MTPVGFHWGPEGVMLESRLQLGSGGGDLGLPCCGELPWKPHTLPLPQTLRTSSEEGPLPGTDRWAWEGAEATPSHPLIAPWRGLFSCVTCAHARSAPDV